MISGTCISVTLCVHIIARGHCIGLLLFTIIASIKSFITMECRMACLTTDLAGYLTASTIVVVEVATTSTAIATTITVSTYQTTATTSASIDLLVLLLRFRSSLSDEKLRVEIIEDLWVRLGGESFHKRIEFEIETDKDVTDHILIIKPLVSCRHLIREALHLGIISSTT
jgi:hypothetical protein